MLTAIYSLGSRLCHQLPQRSLFLTYQSFVCARDIGIYFGVFLGALLIISLKKRNPEPSLALSIFFLPLAIDGLTEYLVLQPSSNFARLWTGLFFGIGISFVLATLFSRNRKQSPVPPRTYILSFILSIIIIPLFYSQNLFLFTFLNTVSFITFVGLIGTLVFLITSVINESIKNNRV